MEKENYYAETKNLPLGFKVLQFYFKNIGRFFPKLSGLIFWKVFCLPKKRNIKEKHNEFLKTSKLNTIDFEDMKIKSYSWEKGDKKVLIIHGWEGMSADFNEIINELTDSNFSVLAIDLPAHGKSTGKRSNIPMIMRLIEKIMKEQGPFYGIVSHSLGAAASAFSLAKQNGSSNLSKLILMGLHPFPFIFFEQFRNVMKIDDKLYRKCLNYVENIINMKLDEFSVPTVKDNVSADRVLLVHDIEDEVVDINNIKRLNNDWMQSELFVGKHGGHFKHYKHPLVVEKVIEFMHA